MDGIRLPKPVHWDNRVDASDVKVEVDAGTVQLTGTVPNFTARNMAETDAWLIDGVASVVNNLTVKFPSEFKIPSDDEIKSNVSNRLLWDPSIDSTKVDISVSTGLVTLTGTVDAYWKKIAAGNIVSRVSGVVDVTNNIAVVPTESVIDEDIAKDITSALKRNVLVDLEDIDIKVENGTATLTGSVSTWAEYDAAMNAAHYTAGVIDVKDHLTFAL